MEKNNQTIQLFNKYRSRIGWNKINNTEKYFKKLERKYNTLFYEVMSIADERQQGNKINPYEIMNSRFDFSMDISNLFISKLFESFFNKYDLYSFEWTPKYILDLGCGNGAITCFLSILFPNAQIVGIDNEKNCINVANQLKEKLNIANCKFINIDYFDYETNDKYDLIFSFTFIKELLDETVFNNYDKFAIDELKELDVNDKDLELSNVLSSMEYLLSDNGSLFCIERLGNFRELMFFINNYESGSLKCDFHRSTYIDFKNPDDEMEFIPALFFKRKISRSSFDEIFYYYSQLEDIEDKEIFNSALYNEALFNSINPKELIASVKCIYNNGSGTEYYEWWKGSYFHIIVNRTTNNFFKTSLYPKISKQEIDNQINSIFELRKHDCEISLKDDNREKVFD